LAKVLEDGEMVRAGFDELIRRICPKLMQKRENVFG
jgi:hypothetical protein